MSPKCYYKSQFCPNWDWLKTTFGLNNMIFLSGLDSIPVGDFLKGLGYQRPVEWRPAILQAQNAPEDYSVRFCLLVQGEKIQINLWVSSLRKPMRPPMLRFNSLSQMFRRALARKTMKLPNAKELGSKATNPIVNITVSTLSTVFIPCFFNAAS